MLTKVTKLADKCMLVKLTIKRASLTKQDKAITQTIQQQFGDNSLTALTKLFRDKASPVNQIMQAINEVYEYHKKNTQPYVDAGPRLLLGDNYMDYTQEIRNRIAKVEQLKATFLPHYDVMVQDDLTYRRQAAQANGRASTANLDDYPTAEQFDTSTAIDVRFSPMPDARHFMFDLSEEDLKAFADAEQEAVERANADTVARMLKPLHSLVERLKEYQGQKGERFHNSLIQNVIEGCDNAQKIAINPTPELTNEINSLRDAAKACLADAEIIKGSAHARDAARAKLEAVAARMSAFG